MKSLKKILITSKSAFKKLEFVGYLVEDKHSKFIALNESQRIALHYPKLTYSYEVIDEDKNR